MSKYKTVLFDADDTLFDFKRAEHDAVLDCLTYAGLRSDESVIETYSRINDGYWKMLERKEITKKELFTARWQSLLDHYGFDFEAQRIAELYPLKLAEKSYPIKGAEEVCKALKAAGLHLYIVTNGFAIVQHGRFDHSPLRKYFEEMFISEEMGADKPSPAYFEAVAKRIPDFSLSETLIIGDSLTSDIKGGIAAGLDTCWYNPKGKAAPPEMRITYVIGDLHELINLLI